MKRFYLGALYLLFGFTLPLFSQDINLGPRITALGNSGVALQDVWSLQANQAGLTQVQRPTASVSYRNSYFNPELSTQSAVVVYPIGSNVLGLSFQNYGFSAYNEQRVGFTYAKRFGNSISAALNYNLHQVRISNYGSVQTYSAEAGLQYSPNKKLTMGTHVTNPSRSKFNTEVDAVVPVNIEFGASYRFTDKVLLNSAVVQGLYSGADLRCGLEYSLINSLDLRGGFSLNPLCQYAGFGYQLNTLKVDAAVSSHPYLGFSPQIAFCYEF